MVHSPPLAGPAPGWSGARVTSLSWARVKPVLEKALSAPAEDRAGVVEAACQGDADLRREVEEYLRYETCAQGLLPLTEWSSSVAAEEEPPPSHIGPWRILREIGCGGMGVVYVAERDDGEYQQTAALKLVRDSRRTSGFVELFRHERQTLAQLNHPNIAHLLDGGTTAAGQPYYAMEYVEGEPLTEYCRNLALSVPSRIRLFLHVCDAVSHAHRHLFIHRDLKPGNILVTAGGEPKLLDFGLAKVLDPVRESDPTASAIPLLTPAYASPEQIRGEPLTTASDVYSLGVILYELVAGALPYKVQGQGPFQTWTAVCEEVPASPSAAAPVHGRYQNAPDLDSIVLKALRKEPEQRYASVDALASDLEFYLAGMPVSARQGSALYHLRRFVSRRRWAVLVATAALAGTCISLGAIFWEQRQAALRFQELRRFAHAVVFELHDSIEQLPGSTAARKLLVERSLEYLRSLEASSGKDLTLKWELAEAYKRIGDAQGNPEAANLGDSAGALDSYARARGLLHQITAADRGNVTALKTLAALDRAGAGILSASGRQRESLDLLRDAVDALRQIALRSPTPEIRKALALSHYNLALSLNQIQDWPAATREWQTTLGLFEDIARAQPGNANDRRNVALSHKRLAAVYLEQRQYSEAIAHYQAAEQIDRARLSGEPENSAAKMDLSFDLSDLGLAMLESHRYSEAVGHLEGALALRREAAAADPDDLRAQVSVGRSLDRLARAYELASQLDRAIETSREAASTMVAARRHDPANKDHLKDAGLTFLRLGFLCRARAAGRKGDLAAADWRSAQTAFERAAAMLNGLDGGVNLTEEDQQRIGSMTAALEDCRRRLLRGHGGGSD